MKNFKVFIILLLVVSVTGCTAHVRFTASRPGTLVQEATLGELGETPLEMDLRHGRYSFVFTLDPCLEARVYRDVRGSEVFVHAELAPHETVLQVSTTPPDAKVRVTWEGKDVDFEEVCRKNPALEDQLRSFHAAYQLAEVAVSSRSFHDAMRERFPDAEELTFSLRPDATIASGPPPDEVPLPRRAEDGRYVFEGIVARGGMGVIYSVLEWLRRTSMTASSSSVPVFSMACAQTWTAP